MPDIHKNFINQHIFGVGVLIYIYVHGLTQFLVLFRSKEQNLIDFSVNKQLSSKKKNIFFQTFGI